ncbi:MAG: DUF1800 domain-containing protein [Saprospiraceae bacterium]
MDRRSFLQFATASRKAMPSKQSTLPTTTTLMPYTGEWTLEQAAFLLHRTTFGPTPAQIYQAVENGLSATIGALFAPQPAVAPPVYYNFSNDPNVALGETWIHTPPTLGIAGLQGSRRRSLTAWQIGKMLQGGTSIKEKMVLFWHEHFPVANINNAQFGYHYLDLLQRNCFGNFRTLVEEITVSPAMLIYLNGNQNTRQAPNENYARELLELFTVGRGDVAAPGDYTNYTEDDVVAMARCLTGWVARTLEDGTVAGVFVPNRHDTGVKQLSHRFDNAIITDAADLEYKVVIDHILQKAEVAMFISRQLHIWFVGTNIDPVVEANILAPMAQLIIDNDYAIQPALEALLGSEYFFDASHRGCMITHPLDYLLRIAGCFMATSEADLLGEYRFWDQIYRMATSQEMVIMDIPSVAGWKAFYQAPQFYDFWINSVTLTLRQETASDLMNGIFTGGFRWELDLLGFIAQIPNNTDPNALIEGIAALLFAAPMSSQQLAFLKEILIPGLPDYEWTIEYSDYLSQPDDPDLRNAVQTKLEAMFSTIFKMPEFYLI